MIDAHKIWADARIPKTEPLDDATAAELARRLAWAKTWYQQAQPDALALRKRKTLKTSTAGERDRLETISSAAKKLKKELLAARGVSLKRIELRIEAFNRDDIIRMLVAVADAADDALKFERGDVALRRIYGSPEKLYIRRLAEIYVDFAKQNPKYKTEEEDHGDFPRFVKAASDGLNLPCPSFTTIRNAKKDCGAEWPAVGVDVGSKKRRGQH